MTQQLLPTADGSARVAACEVLVPTPAVRNLIREGKTHQIHVGDADRLAARACRRWTPRSRSSCAPARSPAAAPRRARRRRRSSAACSASTSLATAA